MTELAIFGIAGRSGANAFGWFNDPHALADAALRYDKQSSPEGIYITLNPLHRACLSRTNNRTQERRRTRSTDSDVSTRQWLFVDLDCVRPSGVSADDDEIKRAIDTARAVIAWMESAATFPRGYRAFSGNGIHLLWRIDLPNTVNARKHVQNCLNVIGDKFDNEHVKIDRGNHNAARLIRLHGTTARKGAHTAERPHRVSTPYPTGDSFVAFEDFGIATEDMIRELASLGRPAAAAASSGRKRRRKADTVDGNELFDLNAFISRHGIEVRERIPFDGAGEKIILKACPFDPAHVGTSAALGRTSAGVIFFQCMHDSCRNRGWRDVRDYYEAPKKDSKNKVRPSKVSNQRDDSDDPWSLAKEFIEEHFFDHATGETRLIRHRENWYRYNDREKKYVILNADQLKVMVTRTFGPVLPSITGRKVSDIINAIAAMVTTPDEYEIPFIVEANLLEATVTAKGNDLNRVVLSNFMLDVDRFVGGAQVANCLLKHTATWFDVTALPFPFPTTEADIECPSWLEFLDQIFEKDQERVDLLQEAFGYCFMPHCRLEAFFVLRGDGNNGKSTCLSVLRKLLGDENVSSLTPDQLASPYMLNQLIGKLANLCGDMGEIDRVEEGVLKTLVSGEPITSDRKYKDAITFKNRAKLFYATNILPRFNDTSLGIWRRMKVLPFDYVVPPDQVDIHLLDTLYDELPGIFLWALRGTSRLNKARRFTQSEKCERSARDYRLTCFPILTFLDECTETGGYIGAHKLWSLYRAWCNYCGLSRPKPLRPFIKDVEQFRRGVTSNADEVRRDFDIQFYGLSVQDGLDFRSEESSEAGAAPRRPDGPRSSAEQSSAGDHDTGAGPRLPWI